MVVLLLFIHKKKSKMKKSINSILLLLLVIFSACNDSDDEISPSVMLGVGFNLSNSDEIKIESEAVDNAYRFYFPNHFSSFTGFDATKFDYISALGLYPEQLTDTNKFDIELGMIVPTTDVLMESISTPIFSEKLFIESSPDSASVESLFSLDVEIELKSNNEISYYSISDPTIDSLNQKNTISKIELLKEKANSYKDGAEDVFTDYYAVHGEIETLMRIENINSISNSYPEVISLKGSYVLVVEVRDTD